MLKKIASFLLAIFLALAAWHFVERAFNFRPWDYSINWTAAWALREGVPLYDRQVMQALAAEKIGDARGLFNGLYSSYIGLPTTAMLHLPFTFLPFEKSVVVYRIAALCAMCLSIFLAGLALPVTLRWRGWLAGTLCMLGWSAPVFSIQLGQTDAWIMLILSVALLSIQRQCWWWAGAAMGLATLLKISPALLLVYCVLKRQWKCLAAALLLMLAGLLLSALPHSGGDLQVFVQTILPGLGDSTRQIQNQALGAFLARLFAADDNLMSFTAVMGGWKAVGLSAVFALLALSYWRNREQVLSAESLSSVIFLVLLAGPISWDHYLSWAILPTMLLAAHLPLRQWPLLLLILLPMLFPVYYAKPAQVASSDWWRVVTGVQTLSMLVLALWMIAGDYTTARSRRRFFFSSGAAGSMP